jgi:hypothetical protein
MGVTLRTTVAIPLHRSARWVDTVAENVERLGGVARIVVSDADEADDALSVLRSRLGGLDVEFRGRRRVPVGWAAHCNDLLSHAVTPYVMWLPHDDEIEPEWILEGERALDVDPTAVLAVGSVVRLGGGVDLPFDPGFSHAEPRARVSAALSALVSGRPTSLGLLFRSVFRRADALTLPDAEWADVPWAIGMLAQGRAVPTTGIYRKRWHPESVSAGWSPMFWSQRLRSDHILGAVERLVDRPAELIAQAWEDEVALMAQHQRMLDVEIARLHDENAAMRASASWRMTGPLRRIRALFHW